ncbi:MAG TPA: histidine phosphatase family protein [Caulobacteraceae bacterium]|jgi:phosphohistidine phosphatase|nr:histidine phosphatase family protein [Caulobacteraceae bacterium]
MRRLILFRHAKAEPRAIGGDDFDRPLSPRGRDDAAIVGRALAAGGYAPDLALISPARRTTETWIAAREAFAPARSELAPALYDAAPEAIREAIDAVAERCDTLVVIGHNPGMQEVAVELLIDAAASAADIEPVAARFPTATAAVYGIDEFGRARLDALYHARELGGEGDG